MTQNDSRNYLLLLLFKKKARKCSKEIWKEDLNWKLCLPPNRKLLKRIVGLQTCRCACVQPVTNFNPFFFFFTTQHFLTQEIWDENSIYHREEDRATAASTAVVKWGADSSRSSKSLLSVISRLSTDEPSRINRKRVKKLKCGNVKLRCILRERWTWKCTSRNLKVLEGGVDCLVRICMMRRRVLNWDGR